MVFMMQIVVLFFNVNDQLINDVLMFVCFVNFCGMVLDYMFVFVNGKCCYCFVVIIFFGGGFFDGV